MAQFQAQLMAPILTSQTLKIKVEQMLFITCEVFKVTICG